MKYIVFNKLVKFWSDKLIKMPLLVFHENDFRHFLYSYILVLLHYFLYFIKPLVHSQELVPSSAVSNGSGEDSLLREDEERHTAEKVKKEASEHLQSKMLKTRDLIKQEQKARDGEYLGIKTLYRSRHSDF